ncbi:hypothetical protein GCM10008983_22650 [Lentibacillus halophilus]|uniref:Barwin domain-containing protein n=1 Tax=Lentibacillus halophilus TaxID=295065 RepID=A0ABP3J7J5_9BACI
MYRQYPNFYPAYDDYIYSNWHSYIPTTQGNDFRQQTISGQATWTEGGQLTKCGIPWSTNQYMTAAVGTNSPYECGQTLKIHNPATGRDIMVTVVDEVPGYSKNQINLHRRAFQTLGINPQQGVANVEITPTNGTSQQKWGEYLLKITQTAYPSYQVTEYQLTDETQVSPEKNKETYQFRLQANQERMTVQGTVIYNSETDRIISIYIQET